MDASSFDAKARTNVAGSVAPPRDEALTGVNVALRGGCATADAHCPAVQAGMTAPDLSLTSAALIQIKAGRQAATHRESTGPDMKPIANRTSIPP
jgi:hypothetical protein